MPGDIDILALAAERVNGFDLAQAAKNPRVPFTLEQLLVDKNAMGLRTASPLQRAICRIMDGSPLLDLASHPDVVAALGDAQWNGGGPPKEMVVASGIRAAKSIIAACRAVQQTQTCDVSGLVAGEVPRVSVLSLKKDLAQVVFGYVCALAASPMVQSRMIGSPGADSVMLRHPSGRPVEIKVAAGARAGSSLVARWSAGVIFDEAPRMVGAEDGVVNLNDARAAVLGRMLPGSTILYPGSPWAPFGPVYDMFRGAFGKPSDALVVVKAPGWAMNPVYWTPERCAELKERDPEVFATDVAAEFADKLLSYLPGERVDDCIRAGVSSEPPQEGWRYIAAMDPATRGNAWTIGIGAISPTGIRRLVYARQWQGTSLAPLSPEGVFESIAQDLRKYQVDRIYTDQWSFDSLADIAVRHGLYLESVIASQQSKVDWFMSLRSWIVDKKVSMVDVPDLRSDLKRVQRRVTQSGITIEMPRTTDGRHCDYAAMLAILFTRHMPEASMATSRRDTWEDKMEQSLIKQSARFDRENDL